MKRHGSLVTILVASVILGMLCSVLADTEGQDAKHEQVEALTAMTAKDTVEDVSSVEVHLNRYPSNQTESRMLWQGGDNGSIDDDIYLNLIELVRNQYMEDVNYSSYVLDEFVKKKIDAREAMTSTMTLFVLTSKTVDMVDQIKPPSKFATYQNVTQRALINLEGYLWNMVKFYETNKRVYAIQAHDNFNKSMGYYDEGTEIYKHIEK